MFEVLPFDFYDRKSILEWYELKKEIDFSPKYQRASQNVWDDKMKQVLIDSIINEFDIPKFYFHLLDINNKINTSKKRYAIIDGKQRLNCIFDFIEGKFSLSNDFIYFKNIDVKLAKLRYQDILIEYPDIAYIFQKFLLDIVYVVTDEDEKVEMFFLRLNSGKPLNNGEKRKAMMGFLNEKIEEVVNEDQFFTNKLALRNIRYSYNDIFAKLVLIEKNGDFVNMDKKTLDNLYDEYREESEYINNIVFKVQQTLLYMSKIFNDKDKLLKVKSSIPVYYWIIRNNVKRKNIKKFLNDFEVLRKVSKDVDILEYNKHQQKGTDKKESMKYRYGVLVKRI